MQRSFGQILRAAREAKSLTLLDVAHRTRIPPNRLQQLEEDNYAAFGSMAYAKSFLKTYSRYLGVDASETLEGLPGPVFGGPNDYRYLTEVLGQWVERRDRNRVRRRKPLARSARSPVPTLAFMFALFVLAGALLASAVLEKKKQDHKPSGAADQPPVEVVSKETHQVAKTAPLAPAVGVSKGAEGVRSAPGEKAPEEQRTIIRSAIPAAGVPAPVRPDTPVRKAQIVD